MKRKLIATIACLTAAGALLAGEILNKGVDFTGVTSLTASKLNNTVDNAYPASHIGFVIVTNDTPSLALHSPTNYIWLDSDTTPYTLKTWRVDSNAWVAGTIAPDSIDSSHIIAGSIASSDMAANSIVTSNINDNAITSAKIAALAVSAGKYAAGSITNADLAADAVSSAKIVDGGIATADIANSAITSLLIATDAIATSNIIDGAVTQAKIAANSVANTNVMTDAIHSTNIIDGTIALADIAANAILESVVTATNNAMPAAGSTVSIAHGLTGVPHSVRTVLVCGTSDLGYAVGDEVDVSNMSRSTDKSNGFQVYTDSSNVNIIRPSADTPMLLNKTTGAISSITPGSWSFRVYAVYFK